MIDDIILYDADTIVADLERALTHLATPSVERTDDGVTVVLTPIDDDGPPTVRMPAAEFEPAPDTERAPAGYPYDLRYPDE